MKAKPLICGNLYYQSQGSHLQLMNKEGFCLHGLTWAPHLVPGILSVRPARAASLLPFSPLTGQRGEGGTRTKTGPKRDAGAPWEGDELHPEALRTWKGFPKPSWGWPQAVARRAAGGGRRWVGEPGRPGGREVAAAALHRPCSAGGRTPPRAQSGVGGRGAGARVRTPPRPAPQAPRGPPAPAPANRAPLGPRRLPAPTSPAP